MNIIILALALWIVTHAITIEMPITSKQRKPLSCQLCLSGWCSIVAGAWSINHSGDAFLMVPALALWALSVFIEALYNRLYINFL